MASNPPCAIELLHAKQQIENMQLEEEARVINYERQMEYEYPSYRLTETSAARIFITLMSSTSKARTRRLRLT
jgi:hypothetical protein